MENVIQSLPFYKKFTGKPKKSQNFYTEAYSMPYGFISNERVGEYLKIGLRSSVVTNVLNKCYFDNFLFLKTLYE